MKTRRLFVVVEAATLILIGLTTFVGFVAGDVPHAEMAALWGLAIYARLRLLDVRTNPAFTEWQRWVTDSANLLLAKAKRDLTDEITTPVQPSVSEAGSP